MVLVIIFFYFCNKKFLNQNQNNQKWVLWRNYLKASTLKKGFPPLLRPSLQAQVLYLAIQSITWSIPLTIYLYGLLIFHTNKHYKSSWSWLMMKIARVYVIISKSKTRRKRKETQHNKNKSNYINTLELICCSLETQDKN